MELLDHKLMICVVASVLVHVGIERALETLPEHVDPPVHAKIEVRVMPPPPPVEPPPEPEKPPEKPPEPEKPPPLEPPKHPTIHAPAQAIPHDTPPQPTTDQPTTATTDTPVYGVTMESTSSAGGVAMPVGNTTKAVPGAGSAAPAVQKPLAAPIAAFEATKMPLPQGRCFGKYTDEAHVAGVEGVVTLDLIVGEDGHVRDVQVVSGLPHGLTESAVAAARACRFSPGERDGSPVAVKIRGFKIRYVLAED